MTEDNEFDSFLEELLEQDTSPVEEDHTPVVSTLAEESKPDSTVNKLRKPFKFLDPYGPEDRDIFFGRDMEISEVYHGVFSNKTTVVFGNSGTGKTSLVECGLATRLKPEKCAFFTIRSAIDPFHSLRRDCLQQISTDNDHSDLFASLSLAIKGLRKTVVLFFDQFEELFILHSRKTRRELASLLQKIVSSDLDVRIVLAIREEYFARLIEFEKIIPEILATRIWVRKMSTVQAREAIAAPCRICGVTLDDGVLDGVMGELAGDHEGVELPFVQVVMDTMYEQAARRDASHIHIKLQEDFQNMDGVKGILANFIEDQIEDLGDVDRARQVLKSLITSEGTKRLLTMDGIAERTASFGEPLAQTELTEIVAELSARRLLREDPDQGLFELRHDFLANIIHQWMTGIEQELMEVRQNLENRFHEYERRGVLLDSDTLAYIAPYEERLRLGPEMAEFVEKSCREAARKRRRLLVMVFSAMTLVLLVVSVLGLLSYRNYQDAEAQKKIAENRLIEVEKQKKLVQEADQKASWLSVDSRKFRDVFFTVVKALPTKEMNMSYLNEEVGNAKWLNTISKHIDKLELENMQQLSSLLISKKIYKKGVIDSLLNFEEIFEESNSTPVFLEKNQGDLENIKIIIKVMIVSLNIPDEQKELYLEAIERLDADGLKALYEKLSSFTEQIEIEELLEELNIVIKYVIPIYEQESYSIAKNMLLELSEPDKFKQEEIHASTILLILAKTDEIWKRRIIDFVDTDKANFWSKNDSDEAFKILETLIETDEAYKNIYFKHLEINDKFIWDNNVNVTNRISGALYLGNNAKNKKSITTANDCIVNVLAFDLNHECKLAYGKEVSAYLVKLFFIVGHPDYNSFDINSKDVDLISLLLANSNNSRFFELFHNKNNSPSGVYLKKIKESEGQYSQLTSNLILRVSNIGLKAFILPHVEHLESFSHKAGTTKDFEAKFFPLVEKKTLMSLIIKVISEDRFSDALQMVEILLKEDGLNPSLLALKTISLSLNNQTDLARKNIRYILEQNPSILSPENAIHSILISYKVLKLLSNDIQNDNTNKLLQYMNKSVVEFYNFNSNNIKFGKLGIGFDIENRLMKITHIGDGSPAEKANIHPGDLIIKINNKDIKEMNLDGDSALKLCSELKGDEISLTIIRENQSKPIVIKLKKDHVATELKNTQDLPFIKSFIQARNIKLYNDAKKQISLNNYQTAYNICNTLTIDDPYNSEFLNCKIRTASELGNYEQVEKDYKTLIETNLQNSDAWGGMGWYQLLQGDFKSAQISSQKGFELSKSWWSWGINLAHTYLFYQKDLEQAKTHYLKVMPKIPDEDSFQQGPIADFKIFKEKGWCTEICQQAESWLKQAWEDEQKVRKGME